MYARFRKKKYVHGTFQINLLDTEGSSQSPKMSAKYLGWDFNGHVANPIYGPIAWGFFS